MVATWTPSWRITSPVTRPRAPDRPWDRVSNQCHSVASVGRWNHTAWSRLAPWKRPRSPMSPSNSGCGDRAARDGRSVGHERQCALVVERIVADVGEQPDPVATAIRVARQLDGSPVEEITPPVVHEAHVVGRREGGRQLGQLYVGLHLVGLERHRDVEDRSCRLAGDDLAGAERLAVTEALHLVADRFRRSTGPDEVGVQRMRRTGGIDGRRRRPQRLGDHLAAEEPVAPRVPCRDADVRVGPVRFEPQQVEEFDIPDPRRAHACNVLTRRR